MGLGGLYLSSLLGLVASAEDLYCPYELYRYKGIECCLEEGLDSQKCESIVDQLPEHYLTELRKVQDKIESDRNPGVPQANCYWAALSFFDEKLLREPKFLGVLKTREILENQFQRVAPNDPTDETPRLVLFMAQVEELVSDYEDNQRVRYWYKHRPDVYHAGIQIDADLIFQKLNQDDARLMISKLETSRRSYHRILNSRMSLRGTIDVEIFKEKPVQPDKPF